MNRKLLGAVCGLFCISVGAGVGGMVAAAATGTPEIDRANATIQLGGNLKPATCVGEDDVSYLTYTGTWSGGEAQMLPDPTDYSLSGALTVKGIDWTINTSTGRGVLTATVSLVTKPGTPAEYVGSMILVSQGEPSATGGPVPARGWINATFKVPDEGASAGDDHLIANVEFMLSPTSANGQFGDVPGSMGIPDYSVVTNVAPTPLDGVC